MLEANKNINQSLEIQTNSDFENEEIYKS